MKARKGLDFVVCLAVCSVLSMIPSTVHGHSKFGAILKETYRLRSVSCTTCHKKGKDKDELGEFGSVLGKLLSGAQIEKRLHEVKELDDDDVRKREVYREIDREFAEALEKIGELKSPSGKTYSEAISSGEIEGAKPRK